MYDVFKLPCLFFCTRVYIAWLNQVSLGTRAPIFYVIDIMSLALGQKVSVFPRLLLEFLCYRHNLPFSGALVRSILVFIRINLSIFGCIP